jgi:shikimate dehydrogenase
VNVTIPHKETVLAYLDEVDQEALLIGAVNTIVNRNGHLCGYNTDGRGFIESLKEAGIWPERKKVLLTGAGGAARAIAFSLALHKASVVAIYDIDQNKAQGLTQAVSKVEPLCQVVEGTPENIQDYDIVINATPLGLKDSDPLPLRPELLKPEHVVYDAIYRRTRLLEQAKDHGAKAIDGSGMLLWQGALAFEIWTGKKPPIEVMRKALVSKLV